MKRLFLVLGLLIATFALAATSDSATQSWSITFPQFAYVWINAANVTFDLTTTSTVNGKLQNLNSTNNPVYPGNQDGLLQCLGLTVSSGTPSAPSGLYTGTNSSTATQTCYFAPNVTRGSGQNFSVNYNDPDGGTDGINSADASLYILSSGRGWTLTASSVTAVAGEKLYAIPLVFDSDDATAANSLEAPDGTNYTDFGTATGQLDISKFELTATSGPSLSQGAYNGGLSQYGYYVQGGFWQYVQPLNFLLRIDFNQSYSATSLSSNPVTYTVTYTVTAP